MKIQSKIVDGDFIPSNKYYEIIAEKESFFDDSQWIQVSHEGSLITINYSINISGFLNCNEGTSMVPVSYDLMMTRKDISILSLEMNGEEIDTPTPLQKGLCLELIKKLV